MQQTQEKTSALNIRIQTAQKNLIYEAAEQLGQNVSDFVREAIVCKAQDILLDRSHFVLDAEGWDKFKQALDKSPKANPRLRDLITRKTPWE